MRRLTIALWAAAAVTAASAPAAAQVQPSWSTCTPMTSLSPEVPADTDRVDQDHMNCFAWREFIALNWAADPETCAADTSVGPAAFGDPAAAGPVVWETFKAPGDVFLPGAAAPPGWCSQADRYGAADPKRLSHPTKFAAASALDLHDVVEAAPTGAWLTAQSGDLTLYEIRINEDEFAYIDGAKLYDASVQAAVAAKQGIHLPDGSEGGVGAIELKAAWIELDDPADRARYLTSEAVVTYPGQAPRTVTVGLTGLHIIHKTQNAQQLAWATFEHVDNAPTAADVRAKRLKPSYTYFNPKCDPSRDHYGCAQNKAPTPGTDPYGAPVQVVRVFPLGSATNNVAGLNQAVWNLIEGANPDSVFLNYQLVNVLWPNNSQKVTGPAPVPLPAGNPQPPPPAVVANTTLETYVQQRQTCTACHSFAKAAGDANPPLAADFSFLLDHAQQPASGDGGGGALTWGLAGAAVAAAAAAGGVALRRRRRTDDPR